jgi:hypothetical protein
VSEGTIRKTREACDHLEAAERVLTCPHLAGPLTWGVTYYRWLTGVGLDAELLCSECVTRREAGEEIEIVSICDACRAVLEDELGGLGGVRGRPEIRVQLKAIDERITETQLPWTAAAILDLASVEGAASWLVVLRDGTVSLVDADSGEVRELYSIELPAAEPDHNPWNGHPLTPRLHASIDASFAAIVNDYGRYGKVYDLRTGRSTLELDAGDYHPETVPFSFAFVEHRGRTVAIHRTAWNRLDVSDAESGQLLTVRGPTSYLEGEDRPEHYLDYFHGRLIVSPDRKRILDDGWVWHPVGIPNVWSLERWLRTNLWESEDGPSTVSLAHRDYYWDHGMCWLDSERIALGGIGEDDAGMIEGVRIFNVAAADSSKRSSWRYAREVGAFAGPAGTFFSDGGRLFTVDQAALSIWDVEAAALTGTIDGFNPTRQHTRSRELIELAERGLRRWQY